MQRRLAAACVVAALSLVPLTAQAAGAADVDALWNQPQGVSVDSAFYVVQEWWDGVTRGTQSDPTQRGLAELAQSNADLLSAYTLLQQKRSGAGPQPVAVIDPFLAGTYNFITGSHAKAPIGSVLNWANQSLLTLEGRGSTTDIVQSLLKDYRSQHAAAQRDLHVAGRNDLVALWATNADREGAFLVKIKGVAIASDGLAGLLNDAAQPTIVVAATKPAAGQAKAKANVKTDKGHGANPKGDDGKPKQGD
ncbi:MAG TPA: hypothetical protein VHK65_02560 [Candidatus Dormibacteraeota bacterium]|nr:hypothetical protein [Candidatus Dormibacteraeota bacterium]